MDAQTLALTTQVEALKYNNGGGGDPGSRSTKGIIWRFKNPDNKSEMVINDRKCKFCKNNFHKQPIWCARPYFLSKEAFVDKKKVEKEYKSLEFGGLSNDFKIALVAIISNEDYKVLETKFYQKIEGEETRDILSTTIEDGCFLSPFRVFICRLLAFRSFLLEDLLSTFIITF